MTCMKCDRELTRCICSDAEQRIADLRASPFLAIDWDKILAQRHLNKFEIERDRAAEGAAKP